MSEFISACENGAFDTVMDLLPYTNGKTHTFQRNDIPLKDAGLCTAAYFGKLSIVKLLIENGADVHANNDWPLRYAVYKKHYEVVEYLLQNDANVDVNNGEAFADARDNPKMLSLLDNYKSNTKYMKLYKSLNVSMVDYIKGLQKLGVTFYTAETLAKLNLNTLNLNDQDLSMFLKYLYESQKNNMNQYLEMVDKNADKINHEFWEWFFEIENLDIENYPNLTKKFTKMQVPKLRKRVIELETEVSKLKQETPVRAFAKIKLEEM